ncbi:Methyltransferase-like protein 1 [Hordeum vulgare]|nr:Methyltransferase-like protein 1 [Hordeum vulgare]
MDGSKSNAEEDDYHVIGDLRSPKIPRRSPDGSKDRESDRREREDRKGWDSSRSETSADRADTRDGDYSSDHNKHGREKETIHDNADESGGIRKGVDSSSSRGGRSDEDINDRRASAMPDNIDEDSRSADQSHQKEEILGHTVEYGHESKGGVEKEETSPRVGNDGWESSGDRRNRDAQPSQIPDTPDRGRDSSWNVKTQEVEGSEQYSRSCQLRDPKETNVSEWRSTQERLDGMSFHGRAGYRQDSRGRADGYRGTSIFVNRYDRSDSIEIRPNSNFDFGREGSVSGKRSDMGAHRDLIPGTTDDNSTNHPEADQSGNTSMVSSFPQQGPKGDRSSRGRGRPNGRDSQRIGVPVPLMPPPSFGALTLPPGQMQHMGPNIPHSPGPPLLPGVFMPQFPGPMVWPGAGGVDVNMLSVPPNLHIPPPVAGEHRFTPSMGAGPVHNVHLNQMGPGMGTPTNMSGLGFNQMSTQNRELTHDKPSGGWVPHRHGAPIRKAPSRGEQNDYSQNFVDTGMRPQNFIRELDLTSVAEDYPKLRELIQRKDEIVTNAASPPMYFKCDLRQHVLSPEFFGTKFDVILVDPPWEEYVHRAPGITDHIEYWNAEEIMNLKIEAIADTPSFLFLWVGDGVGLEQGRQCLKKWGFRRCEDVCWVKTNKKNASSGLRHDSRTLLQHSKEHCLMGIKGTVRRSTDGHVIHANIDTDIIIAEEPTDGSTKKPDDMYRIIEHFALGKRRLELFGEDHNIRPGWLTLGKDLSYSNFNKEAYNKNFADSDGKVWQGGGGRNPPPGAPHLIVTTPEIEGLRPKSPPPKN